MNKNINLLFSVLLLVGCGSNTNVNYTGQIPKNQGRVHLELDNYKSIASFASKDLVPFLFEEAENSTCSPASYALALGGVVSASANVESFATKSGFSSTDYQKEFKGLLNGLNWMEKKNSLRSAVLYQQIGPSLAFDDAKREKMAGEYISSMVSSHESYLEDAQNFFKKEIDLNLQLPQLTNEDDMIATYGALKLLDYFSYDAPDVKNDFYVEEGKKISVNTYSLVANERDYYENDKYASLCQRINCTDVFFILPKDGVELIDIDPYQAYLDYLSKAETVNVTGYLPYFHVKNQIDITSPVRQKNSDKKIRFFDKLLKDDVDREYLDVDSGKQVNDFEFSPKGVKGESVTVIAVDVASAPIEQKSVTFKVDKPFYALSLYDDFPLFISKITDPSK